MARNRTALLLSLPLAFAAPAQAADVTVTLDAGSGFVIDDSTTPTPVERLRVDEATGNVSRNGALFVHTTGTSNTFVGAGAGSLTVGQSGYGYRNSAFGVSALSSVDYGYDNSAFGAGALASNGDGVGNSAFGSSALSSNTLGSGNSAVGAAALLANTTGSANAAFGSDTLKRNTTGDHNSGFGHFALVSNTTGSENTAFGDSALRLNNANRNAAFGSSALRNNSTGVGNSAFGWHTLLSNLGGTLNVAVGDQALRELQTGNNNVAVGSGAGLGITTGFDNTAVGAAALAGQAGSNNVAIGSQAGSAANAVNAFNIYIANGGAPNETGQIRIGDQAFHTSAYIQGIAGSASAGSNVNVDANGRLGVLFSSERYKQDVEDMVETSELVAKLRPVRFHYRPEFVGEEQARVRHYGLIAEEVAEVAPEFVVHDEEGRPSTVRYNLLGPLLLNEVQEQQRTIEALLTRVAELERRTGVAARGTAR